MRRDLLERLSLCTTKLWIVLTALIVGEGTTDSNDGSVDRSSSATDIGYSNSDRGSKMEELIEMEDMVDTDDGVRDNVTAGTGTSVDTGVGEGTLGGREIVEGVGVIDSDGEDGTEVADSELNSVIGVNKLIASSSLYGDPLGRRNDVSKDVSAPSGSASDWTDGDARRSEDSYDSSVSTPQRDSGTPGLDGVCGCSIVDGTEGVSRSVGVGVIDDSVGVDTVETDGNDPRGDSVVGIGDGPGIDTSGDSSSSDSREGEGDGIGSSAGDGTSSVSCDGVTEGVYTDGGKGISSGCTSSTMLLGDAEGIVGIIEGVPISSSTSSRFFVHLHSAVL